MNDRQLRNVVDGLGGKANGVPREDGFDITVASEIMAMLLPGRRPSPTSRSACPRIVVGYTCDERAGHGRRPEGRRAPWPPC